MTTATISIMNTDLAAIPVKEGHTRFYIGSWAWTETNPYLTMEEAANMISKDYRKSTLSSIDALDVPTNITYINHDDKLTFHCHFHGVGSYRNYVVGSVPYGTKATQEWHG